MKYAWIPDLPDHRDMLFTASGLVRPLFIDRLGMSNPVEDQGHLGSCTGQATTSLVEITLGTPPLSRLMAYYLGRVIESTVKQDAGCAIRDVIKGISKQGIAEESTWPYDIAKFKRKPLKAAFTEAAKLVPKIARYERIQVLEYLKQALAEGKPVVFGFSVPAFFQEASIASTGWCPVPVSTDKIIGGHAVLAVGYDDTAPVPFIWVKNSWGTAWGIAGYFKMDQRWFTGPGGLTDDMWTIAAN